MYQLDVPLTPLLRHDFNENVFMLATPTSQWREVAIATPDNPDKTVAVAPLKADVLMDLIGISQRSEYPRDRAMLLACIDPERLRLLRLHVHTGDDQVRYFALDTPVAFEEGVTLDTHVCELNAQLDDMVDTEQQVKATFSIIGMCKLSRGLIQLSINCEVQSLTTNEPLEVIEVGYDLEAYLVS